MGSGSSKALQGVHVVVVGGNFAGIEMAQRLEKKGARVTVIEPKDRLYVKFGGVKAAVQEGFDKYLLIPYDRVFKNKENTIVRGLATSIDEYTKSVSYQPLDNAGKPAGPVTVLSYDFCVLCTGSVYAPPFSAQASGADTLAANAAVRGAIQAAQSVLVVGAGPTGLEVAGIIKEAYPRKEVSVATSHDAVLADKRAGASAKFQAYMMKELQAAGIEVARKTRVDMEAVASSPGARVVSPGVIAGAALQGLPAGPGARADLVIYAGGARPATAWLKESTLKDRLDAQGYIRVLTTYQVDNCASVFAIGDCCGSPDAKAGWLVGNQVAVVLHNITRLAPYKQSVESARIRLKRQSKPLTGLLFVPLGSKAGGAQLPLGVGFKGLLGMKTKWYFADVNAKKLGYKLEELVKVNA